MKVSTALAAAKAGGNFGVSGSSGNLPAPPPQKEPNVPEAGNETARSLQAEALKGRWGFEARRSSSLSRAVTRAWRGGELPGGRRELR